MTEMIYVPIVVNCLELVFSDPAKVVCPEHLFLLGCPTSTGFSGGMAGAEEFR